MKSCHEELIAVNVEATDYEQAIRKVGALLYNNGYVKDTYIDAVVDREAAYPTGLILDGVQVAMPHIAGIHVNRPAVCIAKLAEPVRFAHMGDPDTPVDAELLFMMAIQNPDKQIEMLQSVMGIFTNKEALSALREAKDKDELYRTVSNYMD